MTPPSDDPYTVRIDSPAELLAMVPYLLGFHPRSSLVVVTMADTTVLNAARLDLPTTAEQMRCMTAALTQVAATLHRHGATSAILIVYGTVEQAAPSVRAATTALTAAPIPVVKTLRVDAGRYWSNGDDSALGTPFDPTTSVAAATATAAGMVALPDRAAVAARLAPITGAARERMIQATGAAAQGVIDLVDEVAAGAGDVWDVSPATSVGQALLDSARTHLDQTWRRYRSGTPVDDEQAAVVTVLLDLRSVRALAARRTTGAQWQIDMWVDLVRRAEPDFVAGPAILLTLSALQRGDGTLAAIAIDRALNAAPTDRMAQLLAQVVAAGIDPATITALLAD
jgi:hypothetical protein